MDLHQQAPDPVAGGGHLADDRQLSDLRVFQAEWTQCVRQGAGSFSDDGRVAGICFRFAGVQISDAPHGQTGRVPHEDAFGIGVGDRQSANGFGLVNDEEDLAAPLELLNHGAQSCLVVGERLS